MDPNFVYVEACQARSEVAIKPEFLRNKASYKPYIQAFSAIASDQENAPIKLHESNESTTEEPIQESQDQPEDSLTSNQAPPGDAQESGPDASNERRRRAGESGERQRGQNKKRRLNLGAASDAKAKSLCHAMASGLGCNRACPMSHDRKERREKLSQVLKGKLKSEEVSQSVALEGSISKMLARGKIPDCNNEVSEERPEPIETNDEDAAERERLLLLHSMFGPKCIWDPLPCPAGVNCVIDPLGHTNAEGVNQLSDETPVTSTELSSARHTRYTNIVNEIVSGVKDCGLNKRIPRKKHHASSSSSSDNPLLGEAASMKDPDEDGTKKESRICEGAIASTDDRLSIEQKRDKHRRLIAGKTILAPLTTVGNLPFRRLCVSLGCDVTISEMILSSSVCTMKSSELALFRRHHSEKVFGVQLAGGFPDQMERTAQIVQEFVDCDFVDINAGCPLEALHKKGAGCAMLAKEGRTLDVVRSMNQVLRTLPLTLKTRTGFNHKSEPMLHSLVPKLIDAGISGLTLHGRTAKQRYLREADWQYVGEISKLIDGRIPFIGNGDLFGDPTEIVSIWDQSKVDGVMIGRGALIKPWIFKEIKEQKLLDPSSSERMEYLRQFCSFGLEHWGCDSKGVETTRRFLLEQLSFLHRYVPVGLLARPPQKLNQRPPYYIGRDDLETLMGQGDVGSWIRISEMLLGKIPEGFTFLPKHKSNAYA
eukprot:Protomagalhaensia_sp_Gyna_25__5983@NODE_92_length_5336_cov_75_198037_g71_i0_p1_GENE_NODE_92_length_5336_cov_75_198037_g71_i0NODE_92_length_5336_cov_75_198037_g71_i0_p1_ORF_typecomplete_len728_score136_02Dus/PF01207_17/1_8e75Oxidored_FMN/PF00724_20/0_14_NODE_92_length_5336_cov_75_198037_g71_i031535282